MFLDYYFWEGESDDDYFGRHIKYTFDAPLDECYKVCAKDYAKTNNVSYEEAYDIIYNMEYDDILDEYEGVLQDHFYDDACQEYADERSY